MVSQTRTIICLGNGGSLADQHGRRIAIEQKLCYRGFLDADTVVLPGCWHTSVYDINLPQLMNQLNKLIDVQIIVFDHGEEFYNNIEEFYSTIDMAQALINVVPVKFENSNMSNPIRQIVTDSKSFCILPFIGIHASDKRTRHCCWMKPFETKSYTDFYNDPNSQHLRQQLLANEKTSVCQRCYDVEDFGAISARQEQTMSWAYKLGLKSINDIADNIKLINYEIQLGNKCNAMCRMCNPNLSHLIAKEYFNLGLEATDKGIIKSGPFDLVDFNTIKRMHVAGGEPSINDEFIEFLQKCINEGNTNFEINVSTNCSAISNRFIDLIKHFKNIKFAISIDGFDKINQYIRWPISWDKFLTNIEKLITAVGPNNFYFNTVVSIYNVSRLYELFEFLESNYPNSMFGLSILQEPDIQDITNFPDKDVALKNLGQIKTLKKYQTDEIFQSKINSIIHKIQISQLDLNKLKQFFQFNDQLDQSRQVTLADYIPELAHGRRYLLG